MQARMIRRAMRDNGKGNPETRLEVGDIHDHPQAYLLVRNGMGIPHDEECRKACGMSEEQIQRAIRAMNRAEKGIHPDDFEKFDRGEIAGYRGDGSYIPGPNAATFSEEDDVDGGNEE